MMKHTAVVFGLALASGCGGANETSSDESGPDSQAHGDSAVPATDARVIMDGSDGDDPDLNRSGTRIKRRVVNSGDGAKAFASFYDSQRNEDCSFQAASDGVIRCLPTSVTYAFYFSDAACTVPGAYTTAGCAAPRYLVATTSGASCPSATSGPAYFAIGASIPALYIKSGTTCQVVNFTPGAFDYYKPSGLALDPGLFQAGVSAIE